MEFAAPVSARRGINIEPNEFNQKVYDLQTRYILL